MNAHQFPLQLRKQPTGHWWIEDAQGGPVLWLGKDLHPDTAAGVHEILRMAKAHGPLVAALQTAEALLTQYAIRLSDDGEMTGAILDNMRQVRDVLRRAEREGNASAVNGTRATPGPAPRVIVEPKAKEVLQ